MKRKRIAAALCAAALCISMFSASFAETPAEKVERLRQESAAAEENVEAHEAAVQTAANQKEAYTQKVQAIQQQIEIQKQLVTAQKEVLDEACRATADKLLETERTRALFEDRLVAMYIRHNNSDLATLLSVSTFAEAVRYIDNLRAIAQSDTELLETLRKQLSLIHILRVPAAAWALRSLTDRPHSWEELSDFTTQGGYYETG